MVQYYWFYDAGEHLFLVSRYWLLVNFANEEMQIEVRLKAKEVE